MQLIGHKNQLDQLRKAAGLGQLANSYLFSGPEGIGKRLAAQSFVMELFCECKPGAECNNCKRILHNTHPDVINIDVYEDKKDISIEQLRDMQSAIQLHPLEGKFKVVIINNAERMNQASANSLLKVLEEPPKNTHFFLITSRHHMLLPTILSRCQKLQFSPPPLNEVAEYISKTRNIDKEMSTLIAKITSGSIGLALNFPIETLNDAVSSLKNIWKKPSPTEIVTIAEKWGKSDTDQTTLISILAKVYLDIIEYKMTKRGTDFKMLSEGISAAAEREESRSLSLKISAIMQAGQDLEGTYNKQLLFEQLLFTLAN